MPPFLLLRRWANVLARRPYLNWDHARLAEWLLRDLGLPLADQLDRHGKLDGELFFNELSLEEIVHGFKLKQRHSESVVAGIKCLRERGRFDRCWKTSQVAELLEGAGMSALAKAVTDGAIHGVMVFEIMSEDDLRQLVVEASEGEKVSSPELEARVRSFAAVLDAVMRFKDHPYRLICFDRAACKAHFSPNLLARLERVWALSGPALKRLDVETLEGITPIERKVLRKEIASVSRSRAMRTRRGGVEMETSTTTTKTTTLATTTSGAPVPTAPSPPRRASHHKSVSFPSAPPLDEASEEYDIGSRATETYTASSPKRPPRPTPEVVANASLMMQSTSALPPPFPSHTAVPSSSSTHILPLDHRQENVSSSSPKRRISTASGRRESEGNVANNFEVVTMQGSPRRSSRYDSIPGKSNPTNPATPTRRSVAGPNEPSPKRPPRLYKTDSAVAM